MNLKLRLYYLCHSSSLRLLSFHHNALLILHSFRYFLKSRGNRFTTSCPWGSRQNLFSSSCLIFFHFWLFVFCHVGWLICAQGPPTPHRSRVPHDIYSGPFEVPVCSELSLRQSPEPAPFKLSFFLRSWFVVVVTWRDWLAAEWLSYSKPDSTRHFRHVCSGDLFVATLALRPSMEQASITCHSYSLQFVTSNGSYFVTPNI